MIEVFIFTMGGADPKAGGKGIAKAMCPWSMQSFSAAGLEKAACIVPPSCYFRPTAGTAAARRRRRAAAATPPATAASSASTRTGRATTRLVNKRVLSHDSSHELQTDLFYERLNDSSHFEGDQSRASEASEAW